MRYQAIENFNKPRDGLFQITTDSWWIVNENGDPLVYSKSNSPQCNKVKEIAERIAAGRPMKKIPVVYMQIRTSDYD